MVIALILSPLGFINALYLYYQHLREVRTGQKMVCFIGTDCGAVVGSKYGKTFGLKNELIGMGYYALIGIFSLLSIFLPLGENFLIWIKLVALIASFFSLYLLYIQLFVLRIICSWCMVAITINLIIFISVI